MRSDLRRALGAALAVIGMALATLDPARAAPPSGDVVVMALCGVGAAVPMPAGGPHRRGDCPTACHALCPRRRGGAAAND